MKKIVLVLVAAMVLVFTGCEKKETISMPFDVADVNNIEMYRNAEPYSAEKQVITESEDIADLYSLFSGLESCKQKSSPEMKKAPQFSQSKNGYSKADRRRIPSPTWIE